MTLIRDNLFQVWRNGWSHNIDLAILFRNIAVAGALERARWIGVGPWWYPNTEGMAAP